MKRTLNAAHLSRVGEVGTHPSVAIFGPKVMISNELSGSGGDMFPWLFKKEKIGPVVGKRTWGGLVGAWGFSIVDGGYVRSPDVALFDPATGEFIAEGHGVDPDIEVELDPYLWRQGKDAQLVRAIEEMNKRLAAYKKPELKRPAYPDKSKVDPKGG
jgi:tricorn protease